MESNRDADEARVGGGPWQFFGALLGPGLRGGVQRYAAHLIVIGVAVVAIWLTNLDVLARIPDSSEIEFVASEAAAGEPNTLAVEGAASGDVQGATHTAVIMRQIDPHTNIPARPRRDVITYVVESGDTLFGIAEKFGITPETVLWGNQFVLGDDPHSLRPGQELSISPVNGVLRVVQPGDTIDGLATVYRTTADAIINWPGNELDPDNPILTEGQVLVVPGGEREFVQWVIPQITRTQRNALPVDAGPGACAGGYSGGAVGTGSFIWPANNRFISGNNYSSFHLGIDIAAGYGDPIYASDSGVAVFAGWNNWGYGNLVVIDHGNGWQTMYAHLSQWNVSCGQSVQQGAIVGLAGSTGNSSGPHLHFEMNFNGSRPNPWNYLQ